MARVVIEDDNSSLIFAQYSVLRICIVGAALGLVFWLLTLAIGQVIDSVAVAGDIAAVITAAIGIIVMVRLRMSQPLIIALASCFALWGLAGWINGLAIYEVIFWSVALYLVCYLLFSWIARYSHIVPVLSIIALVIIATRIVTSL